MIFLTIWQIYARFVIQYYVQPTHDKQTVIDFKTKYHLKWTGTREYTQDIKSGNDGEVRH